MFYKVLNIIKLIISYLSSIILGRVIHWGLPLGISIEPVNTCNLSCPECPTGLNTLTRAKNKINQGLFKNLINELNQNLTNVIFYFQGEPFINPEIYDLFSYASHKRIYSITSTNGHFFNNENAKKTIASGLKKLIISIDGTTQEVYEKYRINGSLSKVIDGVKRIIAIRKMNNLHYPKVVFQFLVTSENEHQINDAKKLANDLSVDKISFKSAQIYDFEKGHSLIPKNEKYSRYKKQPDGTYKIKSKLKNRCWRMWSHPVVTVTGDVVPCCFDKDARYVMGNLNNNSFKEIWNSENYKLFRYQVFKKRKAIDICRNCTEGLLKLRKQ